MIESGAPIGPMRSYAVLLAVGIGAIVVISTVIVVSIGGVLTITEQYALRIDPVIDRQSLFTTRVSIQNVGGDALTGVTVNFGGGDTLHIGSLAAGQNMIVSPPANNAMEMVVITTDEGLIATKEYCELPKMVGMMGS